MSLNDWWCKPAEGGCGREYRNVVLPAGKAPECCGHPDAMVTLWDHGKPPATDMHEPEFNHATGKWHKSTREAEFELAKMTRAWSDRTGMKWSAPKIAGDKHHGARYETKPTNAAFGYAGQTSKRSTGERGRLVDRGVPVKFKTRRPKEPTPDYAVNGITPRRMSREQAAAYRASPKHD